MSSIEQLLGDIIGDQATRPERVSLPVDIIIRRLRDYKTRFDAGCPFKPGDIVTPRAESNYKGQGEPHLVLEVFEKPHRSFTGDVSSHEFGVLYDMRVITLRPSARGEVIISWTVTSCDYQPFVG